MMVNIIGVFERDRDLDTDLVVDFDLFIDFDLFVDLFFFVRQYLRLPFVNIQSSFFPQSSSDKPLHVVIIYIYIIKIETV